MIKVNTLQAWLLAARPKTLTGAMIPVLLAGALAWHDGAFSLIPPASGSTLPLAIRSGSLLLPVLVWTGCLLFACLMQVAANFINDLFDFLKGTDREDRLGPERACAQGWISPQAMRWGIGLVLFLAAAVGIGIVFLVRAYLPWQGLELVVLGGLCIVFAFLYTTCFSYLGLGDLLVLVFFGFVPVCTTHFLLTLSLTADAALLGLISGLAIDALLIVNNFRDRDQDRQSGKRTIVVLLGERFGLWLYLGLGIVVTFLILLLLLPLTSSLCPRVCWPVLLPMLYPLLHLRTWQRMATIGHGKALNSILGETSRNMFLMALLLSLALILLP